MPPRATSGAGSSTDAAEEAGAGSSVNAVENYGSSATAAEDGAEDADGGPGDDGPDDDGGPQTRVQVNAPSKRACPKT